MFFFFLMIRLPPRSTLFPYTTLSQSGGRARPAAGRPDAADGRPRRVQAPPVGTRHEDLHQGVRSGPAPADHRSEEHTSELQSRQYLVCRLLLAKKKKHNNPVIS